MEVVDHAPSCRKTKNCYAAYQRPRHRVYLADFSGFRKREREGGRERERERER